MNFHLSRESCRKRTAPPALTVAAMAWLIVSFCSTAGAEITGRVISDDNANGSWDAGEQMLRDSQSACHLGVPVFSGIEMTWTGPQSGSTRLSECDQGGPYFTSGPLQAGIYELKLSTGAEWEVIGRKSIQVEVTPGGTARRWFFVRKRFDRAGPILSINRLSFCGGESWDLLVTQAPPGKSISLDIWKDLNEDLDFDDQGEYQGRQELDVPVSNHGTWSFIGEFDEQAGGATWQIQALAGEEASNPVSFTVLSEEQCYAPRLTLLNSSTHFAGTANVGFCVSEPFSLELTNATPNQTVFLTGWRDKQLAFEGLAIGRTDESGTMSPLTNVMPAYAIGEWEEQAIVAGRESKRISFSVIDCDGPASPEARPVIVSDLVILDDPPYRTGSTLHAEFTMMNQGQAPITFDVVTVGSRINEKCPDERCPDFDWHRGITLQPGSSYTYRGQMVPEIPGDYDFFAAYRLPDLSWNRSIPDERGISNNLGIAVSGTRSLGAGGISSSLDRYFPDIPVEGVQAATIAQDVIWINPVNVTVTGNSIKKTSGCDGCGAGAISSQTISGDGYIEFTVSETTTDRGAGLNHNHTDNSLGEIDFAVLLWKTGVAEVRENGLYKWETRYLSGDIFRIEVLSNKVSYQKNGVTFYTSTQAPTYPLLFDTSLWTLNATISNGKISQPDSGGTGETDTTPPLCSNGSPSGSLSAGTTSATLSLTTDESATCRYATAAGTAYSSMPNTFSSTGGTSHSTSVTGLTNGGSYSYFVRCRDTAGNANPDDFTIGFSIANASSAPTFEETVFATGLAMSSAMEFAPDGRLFVAEKAGRLRVIKDGMLLSTPFATLPVIDTGERGVLGIAFDPNFSINGYVYIYYSASATGKNRVSRLTASASNIDVAEPGSELLILDDLGGSDYHNAGAIHFGTDGKLYVAVGDASAPSNGQSLGSLAGKLLRIDPLAFPSIIPPDNPFVGTPGARGEIWALGLRNPFTFAVDSETGRIHINDVGASTWEEINLGQAGANYGWSVCEGVCSDPNYKNPIYSYNHDGGQAAITGGTFYRGTQFPLEYRGSYFFADYLKGFIRRLTPDNLVINFATARDNPVDLKVGPDGSLYYLSLWGTVYKITYVTNNQNPVAVASADPTSGLAPLNVTFSGLGSSDPDGDPLTYTWNFGDGSAASEGVTVAHTYTLDGPYNATLTVSDPNGGASSAGVKILVGNPPAGSITSPIEGAIYNAGDTIFFEGTASDTEDGQLVASAFSWTIRFHHLDHFHPFLGPIDGTESGSFVIPKTGETDDRVWYRIHLTVKDASGLTHESIADVLPNKSVLTIATVPSGLQLTLDGIPVTTPHSVVGVVGMQRTLGAASLQTLNGKTYDFQSWSDGGAATHTIETPAIDTTHTANYAEVVVLTAQDVIWTNPVNVTVTGNSIKKTSGCDGCGAGAISSQTVSGDGYIEFTVTETTTDRGGGLNHSNADTSLKDIDFAVLLWKTGVAEVRENGLYKWETRYLSGDIFRIEVVNNQVSYKKNGVTFYTSTQVPTYPLLFDTSLWTLNATISNGKIFP